MVAVPIGTVAVQATVPDRLVPLAMLLVTASVEFVATGVGTGVAVGTGVGAGVGTGVAVGTGVGAGIGIGVGAGVGAGVGTGEGVGMEPVAWMTRVTDASGAALAVHLFLELRE